MLANAQPKPRPKLLDKRDRQRDLERADREQKAIVRERSGGQCEVKERCGIRLLRCPRPAMPGTHHLIGGSGRRNVGRSILAAHRIDVCARCHEEITHHVLVPYVSQELAERAASVRYERRS